MNYVVYLDEFGHLGPFLSRNHKKFSGSPVFGLAGFVLPIENVRNFGSWFFQFKNHIFQNEIEISRIHPAVWEKKGNGLFTIENFKNYPNFLKRTTNRLLNKINNLDGYIFYVGEKKVRSPDEHSPDVQYIGVLKEAIKRLDKFCGDESKESESCRFLLVLDQHTMRSKLVTQSAITMYNKNNPCLHLIEQPFQVESHRYQTIQAADWISGLVGRLGAYWKNPDEYSDYAIFSKYFSHRLNEVSLTGCGIRG